MEIITRRNPVLETLRAQRRKIHCLWVQQGADKKLTRPLLTEARKHGVQVKTADKQKLSKLAQDGKHQGVVLEVERYPYSDVDAMLTLAKERGERPFLLILDLLHGPQNIGTLLRTAEIVGVHGVILQDRRAPDITPSVVQYAAGATEHLHIAKVTNLVTTIRELQANDIWIVGMDLDEGATSLSETDLNMGVGIVVGHEGQGMRRLVRESCDIRLILPQKGHVQSLNASVAGSVLLYAAWQARGYK